MIKSICSVLRKELTLMIYLLTINAYGQSLQDIPTTSTEFEFSCVSANKADWNTPLVTHNNHIYFAFIDNNLRLIIAKKNTQTNQIQTQVVFSKMINDVHHIPSIGIDAQGYIHLVAGMHHSKDGSSPNYQPVPGYAWQYWKSDKPENISSFTFIGNQAEKVPASNQISYPVFASDRKGVLYLAYRAESGVVANFTPGKMSLHMAKYDVTTQTWTTLGAIPPGSKEKWKAIAWENAGSAGSGYQGYKANLFFDKNNRMHLAYVVNIDNSRTSSYHYTNGTDVIYAYSDDGGKTFRKANGQAVNLPINHKAADVVFHTSPGSVWFKCDLAVDQRGNPYIFWHVGSNERWSYWSGSSWSKAVNVPDNNMDNAFAYAFDKNNILNYFKSGKVYRTNDLGTNVKSFELQDNNIAGSQKLDHTFFYHHNQFRVSGLNSNSSKIKVQTLIFSNNTIDENTPPIARAGADQSLTDGDGNEAVTLDASASSDADGKITQYTWSENGKQIASGVKPTVNLSIGTHTITLTVTDDDGQSGTDQVVITINTPSSQSQPPVAKAGADQTLTDSDGNGNEAVTLDASASSDPDGTITQYKWSKNGNQIATGVKPTVNLSVGTHTITLTVTDDDGQSGTDQVVIYVNKSSNSDDGKGGSDGYCTASGSTLSEAKQNFKKHCGIKYDKSKGHDCDPDGKGGYICSTGDVGSSDSSSGDDDSDSPSSSDDDKGGSDGYCIASGSTIKQAINNFENACGIKYDKSKGHDCDPDGKGGYICSTGDIGSSGGSSGDDGGDSPSSSDDDKGGNDGYCTASGNTITQAINNFENACGIKYDKSKGHDCDPDGKGGYICSTGDVNQSTARVSTASTKAVDTEQDAAVSLSENAFEPGDALLIQQVYPNPIQEVLNIRISSQYEDVVSINLMDQLGRSLLHREEVVKKGDNLISIELSQISIKQGVLFLRIDSEKIPLKSIKLLKTPSSF